MTNGVTIEQEITARFGEDVVARQATHDDIPTLWVTPDCVKDVLRHLKTGIAQPFRVLYDVTAIDERTRVHREDQPSSDFTMVYHLMSFERNADVRIKTALSGDAPTVSSVADIFHVANWYEREVWDMFGIRFDGHPNLRRILMPDTWQGHPLRKDHPARATEMEPFELSDEKQDAEQEAMRFRPEDWGMESHGEDSDYMFLNLGPHHPGTHGLLRVALQLNGEEVVNAVPEIGFHHRGAEKMGERQTWHSYIPYTDRVDYLGGVMNNLPYVLAVERLAGIEVPDRAKVIRIMMSEFFRLSNHLVFYGTFAGDIGAMAPVFYLFNDRERLLDVVMAICGARMHPGWFRIGGVAQDLPKGWDRMVREFLDFFPPRIAEYNDLVLNNIIFKKRTMGVGAYTLDEAMEWGVTGPGLRACGLDWDLRKKRPYSGFEHFDFEVPTAQNGDCYDRGVVHMEEMRQSLRIIEQCLRNMPEGPYKADHPLTTPPPKERTMHDIETLIHHFLNVSWGPVIPPGEAHFGVEGPKGHIGYYLTSDGGAMSYRTRIRVPSFPHIQMLPVMSQGVLVSDLLAILGSIDFVLSDVDR